MSKNIQEQKLLLRTRLTVLIAVLILNLLFALVWAPLYTRASTDIALRDIPYIIDFIDAAMLATHLISFFICYGITIYSIFRFSLKNTIPTMLIFAALTVFKYAMNLISAWFVFDTMPSTAAERNMSFLSVASNTALELFQYAVVIIISAFIITRAMPAIKLRQKQLAKLESKDTPIREFVFPFEHIYSKKNTLQKAALFSAVAISALQIIQLLIYDFFIGGIPTNPIDIVWMIVYYLGTFILGAIGYMIMLLILICLDKLDKKYTDNKESPA